MPIRVMGRLSYAYMISVTLQTVQSELTRLREGGSGSSSDQMQARYFMLQS